MNPHHDQAPDSDSDSALESLIRSRAGRLAQPDPAWREATLTACKPAAAADAAETAAAAAKSTDQPSARRLWPIFPRGAAWGSLAACWLAVLALNHETRQLNTSTSVQSGSAPSAGSSASLSAPGTLATFSSLPQGGGLLLFQADPAILTFLQNPQPRPPAPTARSKRPPPHSSLAPARAHPDPFV